MKNRSLAELEEEGKKALQESKEYAWGKHDEKSKQTVGMIAKKEGVDFDELWNIFKKRTGAQLEFLIPEHAPIEYWYFTKREDRKCNGWRVWTGLCSYYKATRNLGEALVIARRAFEEKPWEFEEVTISFDGRTDFENFLDWLRWYDYYTYGIILINEVIEGNDGIMLWADWFAWSQIKLWRQWESAHRHNL